MNLPLGSALFATLCLSSSALPAPPQSTLTKIQVEPQVEGASSHASGFGQSGMTFNRQKLVLLGSDAYFTATNPATGLSSLWRSDGTNAGTLLVSSTVTPNIWSKPVAFGGKLYFGGTELGSQGLWVTQGTSASTQFVVDLDPIVSSIPDGLVLAGGQLFYNDYVAGMGKELIVSDGTASGTHVVLDLAPGFANSNPRSITPLPGTGKVVFVADDGAGVEGGLWISDGTGAGTSLLADIQPGSPWDSVGGFVPLGNALIFSADDGVHGFELWATDGTPAGTHLVTDLEPGPGPSYSLTLLEGLLGGRLYFAATTTATGWELFSTDGTSAGTGIAIDAVPGPGNSFAFPLEVVGGNLLVRAELDAINTGAELYLFGGTSLALIKDLATGFEYQSGVAVEPHSSNPTHASRLGSKVLFRATLDSGQDALWVTDGTPAGTLMLEEQEHVIGHQQTAAPEGMTQLSPTIALYRGATVAHGFELHVTDGTLAGTGLLVDIDPAQTPLSTLFNRTLVANGEDLYLFTQYGTAPRRLVCLSATSGLAELTVPSAKNVGDGLRFDWVNGQQLITFEAFLDSSSPILHQPYKTDGTQAGTLPLLALGPGMLTAHVLGSTSKGLFLTISDPATGDELWITDGSPSGYQLVKDMVPGPAGSGNPSSGVTLDDRFLFAADDATHERALFSSDGTAAGTQLILDIAPGSLDKIEFLTVEGGQAYFLASDGTTGTELWATDGTTAGTQLLADVTPGSASTTIKGMVPFAGELYFSGSVYKASALWRTDGTPQGTQQVPGIEVKGFDESSAAASGGKLYFGGAQPGLDLELWSFDGTTLQLVKDINPGTGSSAPSDFVACGERVYFSAFEPSAGREVFTVEAQTDVVQLAVEVVPGPLSSFPSKLTLCDGDLFFKARDAAGEDELYRYTLPGAHALDLGFSGGGAQLEVSPPVVGLSVTATVADGPPNSIGLLAISAPLSLPSGAFVEAGHTLWVDALSYSIISTSLATGWATTLPIPNQPSFIGLQVNAQAWFLPPQLLPVATSNGVRLVLGN